MQNDEEIEREELDGAKRMATGAYGKYKKSIISKIKDTEQMINEADTSTERIVY